VRLAFELVLLLLCLLLTAAYAGGETAFYTVSRVRVDMESRRGQRGSQLVQHLLVRGPALVGVFVIGLNLAVELLIWRAEGLGRALGLSELSIQAGLTLVLTPLIFFFGELLPKDLFRRRPHFFLRLAAPLFALSQVLFWPLERLLRMLSVGLAKLLRLPARSLSIVRGREAVLGFLREGARGGALPAHAEQIARNVLKLRSIQVARAMVPWKAVEVLPAAAGQEELYRRVSRSPHTRLPVVSSKGEVQGYVHQLDVLGDGPTVPVLGHLRELVELSAHLPVDRALARLRTSGQRIAIVGTRTAPRGLLTLKDLVEEISGDLAGW
jgi:putative hemolysin